MIDRNQLMVTRGHVAETEITVLFFRVGTGFYPCSFAKQDARNDFYLRGLVASMQQKVPRL